MQRDTRQRLAVLVQNKDGTKAFKALDPQGTRAEKPRLRETLPPHLLDRVNKLFHRTGYLIQPTAEKWLNGFLAEPNPEEEVLIWERVSDVTDKLWVEQPKSLRSLDREMLTLGVIAVSLEVVDIPSQLRGFTREQIELIRNRYAAAH